MTTLLNTIEHAFAKKVCVAHHDRSDELLEILHEIQKEEGFLSDAALRTISKSLNLSRAEVHGVVSFYHDFKREKQAENVIKICRAEACQAVGVNELISRCRKLLRGKIRQWRRYSIFRVYFLPRKLCSWSSSFIQ